MTNKQSKKLFALTVSSALVASVITPVASAQTQTFPDVGPTNIFKNDIETLAQQSIINGFPDKTFRPNATLLRRDVVTMLAKYLNVFEEMPYPSDYMQNKRFADMQNVQDANLLMYAALAYDQGIFQGSDGRLLYNSQITRQEAGATVLRLVSTASGFSSMDEFMTFLKAQPDFNSIVTDLNVASPWARETIQALSYLAITRNTQFYPKSNISRGEFSAFLNRAMANTLNNAAFNAKVAAYLNGGGTEEPPTVGVIELSPNDGVLGISGAKPGSIYRVYDRTGKEIGYGVVDSSGKLNLILTSVVSPNEKLTIQVSIDGQTISYEYTVPALPTDTATLKQQLTNLINGVEYVAVSTDGNDVLTLDKWTTADRKVALETAVSAAQNVVSSEAATGAQLQAAMDALQAAIQAYSNAQQNGLKNPTEIEVAKQEVKNVIQSIQYVNVSANGIDIDSTEKWTTEQTKATLQAAVSTAQRVVDDANATKDQIEAAKVTLQAAVTAYTNAQQAGLKNSGAIADAKSALVTMISNIQFAEISSDGRDIDPSKKWTTAATKSAMDQAILDARSVINDATASLANVDAAKTALQAAIASYNAAKRDGLKNAAVDQLRADLQTLLNSATNLNEATYTTNSWTVYDTKKNNATTVLNNPNASEQDIRLAITELQAALTGLVKKNDLNGDGMTDALIDELNALVNSVNALDATMYTSASWTTLKTAVNKADGTYANDAEVQAIINEIKAARDGLQLLVNVTSLQALITQAKNARVATSTNGAEYPATTMWTTEAALKTFNNEIQAAETIATKVNVTQAEVSTAMTNLQNALNAYNTAKKSGQQVNTTNINTLIQSAKATKVKVSADGSDIPTSEQWTTQGALNTLNEAIGAAERVAGTVSSTVTDVNNAYNTLNAAISTYNAAKRQGTQVALAAEPSVNSVALKYTDTQYNVPVGSYALNQRNSSFNVLGVTLGQTINADLIGQNNQSLAFTVGANQKLSFTFDAKVQSVLNLGKLDVAVYKKNSAGTYDRVWIDSFTSFSLLGMAVEEEFTVSDLEQGEYVLAASTSKLTANVIGSVVVTFKSSVQEKWDSTINNSLNEKTTTGKVNFTSGATIRSITTSTGQNYSNLTASTSIESTHGNLIINPSTGAYSYVSKGAPSSIGKVDVFEYEIVQGTNTKKEKIYIRHNAYDSTVRPLSWDENNLNANASLIVTNPQAKSTSISMNGTTVNNLKDQTETKAMFDSPIFYVNDTASIIKFKPYTVTLQSVTNELVKLNGDGTEQVVRTNTFNRGAVESLKDVSWTGIEPGYYLLRSKGKEYLSKGYNDLSVTDVKYVSANVTGTLFTKNATNVPSDVSFIAPGTEVYVNGNRSFGQKIQGDYGQLELKQDGTYTYVPNRLNNQSATKSEVFNIRYEATDGTTKSTTLAIRFSSTASAVPETLYTLANSAIYASTINMK